MLNSPLAVTGSYAYVIGCGPMGGNLLRRYPTAGGEGTTVAGNDNRSVVDGTGTDASFTSVSALFSDGTELWAVDYDTTQGNGVLREVTSGSPLPASVQPGPSGATIALDPATVTTSADSGSLSGADAEVNAGGAAIGGQGGIGELSLPSGSVTTFLGDPGGHGTGCHDSSQVSQVAIDNVTAMATDGHYLTSTTGAAARSGGPTWSPGPPP